MKKLTITCFIFLLTTNCSLDNKTGIWEEENNQRTTKVKEEKINKSYEDVFVSNTENEEEREVNPSEIIKKDKKINTINWQQEFYNDENNVSNFSYKNKQILISKSSKLAKSNIEPSILFTDKKIVSYDHKGRVFVYSILEKKKIFEYNFYKKKFKKYKKILNLIIYKQVIYVADNLGYIYAIDLDKKELKWAQNYGIPFRSNIKIYDGKLFLSNQDNTLYSLNINNGEKNWQYDTSSSFLKSDFQNNLLIDKTNNLLFFLNTSGELYAIDLINNKVIWVNNFNRSSNTESNLFLSFPLSLKNENLLVYDGKKILNLNSKTGIKNWETNLSLEIKPVLTSNNVFFVTKNNYLTCLNMIDGKIIWSKNIDNQIKNLREKFKTSKLGISKSQFIVNNFILVFTSSGYLLTFDISNGKILTVNKILKNQIGKNQIFANQSLYLLDKKNRLFKFN